MDLNQIASVCSPCFVCAKQRQLKGSYNGKTAVFAHTKNKKSQLAYFYMGWLHLCYCAETAHSDF